MKQISPQCDSLPAAASISRDFLTSKCDYFVEVQLWPVHTRIDPEAWLSNFEPDEMNHAVHLLNSFMYFCDDIVKQLLASAFQRLSMRVVAGHSMLRARSLWVSFVDSLLVTRVTGEKPNDTDSGFSFQRMARQHLRLDPSRILPPEQVLSSLLAKRGGRVLFLDDFVGSGNQFRDTWTREYSLGESTMSFRRIAASLTDAEFVYCPVMATEYGLGRIKKLCSEVNLAPAHVIPDRYSALVSDSLIWPPELSKTGPRFIEKASRRAGIPKNEWQGFHDLGLALAFEHCVPDATLPIFYWSENDWRPLLERT